jgi:cobalamin-dependent methionine synthase I
VLTSLGVSNVSFGGFYFKTSRPRGDQQHYAVSLVQAGLDMAIVNPAQI